MFVVLSILVGCGGRSPCGLDGLPGEEGAGPINGTCAPEGELYTDHYTCIGVVGPCPDEPGITGASAHVTEADGDPARLDDPDRAWVEDQLWSCSCICCHVGPGAGGHRWAADFSPIWTDSMPFETLERLANTEGFESPLDPADNNGFDRLADIPSTDAARFQAYIIREYERRTP